MTHNAAASVAYPAEAHEEMHSKTVFGFWVYLMTDCVLFSSFFAAWAVLHHNTYGGPSGKELFSLPYALGETFVLLTSSYLCGLAVLSYRNKNKGAVLAFLIATFLLGAVFLGMELHEFAEFFRSGNSWHRSGFLTGYFSLVGAHGLHITTGLLWLGFLLTQLYFRGFTLDNSRRLACFSLFWHFLDVIWIFIFTFVYLMSVR